MKAALFALAAAATISAAAPAFAAQRYERYSEQQQEQPAQYAGLSQHCQQVLNNPDRWGSKEVTFCQNSIP